MWRVFGNIIEMFIYATVYMVIMLVALKIMGTVFSADFEKRISEEGNIGLSIICACLCIGVAIVVSTILR